MIYFCIADSRRGCLTSLAEGADILKRRLLTLRSDVQKSRKFQKYPRNSATVDVLRDVDYPSVLIWVRLSCIFICPTRTLTMWHRECLYSAWASRCRFRILGNARASERGTTAVGIHVFFVPICEDKEYKQLIIKPIKKLYGKSTISRDGNAGSMLRKFCARCKNEQNYINQLKTTQQ